ncbi:hypothetical protein CEXT_399431 [Caerostris extrusa]|uniref:Uncharacterized protein n=1 Tax=Caerostris extrusa TaxID=172846 RepID=A0AAV4QP42_CAEEX|nr:hypothetical protein CEXT_399431 [Caerostris extrusa]
MGEKDENLRRFGDGGAIWKSCRFFNLYLGGKECLLPNHRDSVLKKEEWSEKMRIFEDLWMGVLSGRAVDFSNLDLGGKECRLPNHRDSVLKYTVRNLAANELSVF